MLCPPPARVARRVHNAGNHDSRPHQQPQGPFALPARAGPTRAACRCGRPYRARGYFVPHHARCRAGDAGRRGAARGPRRRREGCGDGRRQLRVLGVTGGWAWGCLRMNRSATSVDRLEAFCDAAQRVHRRRRRHHQARIRAARRPRRFALVALDEAQRKDPADARASMRPTSRCCACPTTPRARRCCDRRRQRGAGDRRWEARRLRAGFTAFPSWSGTTPSRGATRETRAAIRPGSSRWLRRWCAPDCSRRLAVPATRSGLLGGGKALIARFEADRDIAFRDYGLGSAQPAGRVCRPDAPVFAPAVIRRTCGMVTEVRRSRRLQAPERCVMARRVLRRQPDRADEAEPDGELLLRASMGRAMMELYVFARPTARRRGWSRC